MRFLVGLIVGAVATLLVAAALDAPADRLVDKLVHVSTRLGQAVDSVQNTVKRTRPQALDAAPVGAAGPATSAAEPEETRMAAGPQQPLEPEMAVAGNAVAVNQDLATNRDEAANAEAAAGLVVNAEPDPEPLAATMLAPIDPPQPTAELPVGDFQQAIAWGPFHSEASAMGYARRLSRETARAFSVVKRGAANYAVVFSYVDAADLAAAQAQIAAVTGIDQP